MSIIFMTNNTLNKIKNNIRSDWLERLRQHLYTYINVQTYTHTQK